jgi:hypothetical protein
MTLSILSDKPIPANAKDTQLACGFGVHLSSSTGLAQPTSDTSCPQIGCTEQNQQAIDARKAGQSRQFDIPTGRFVIFKERLNAPTTTPHPAQGVSNWQGGGAVADIASHTFRRVLMGGIEGEHIKWAIAVLFGPFDAWQVDGMAATDRQIIGHFVEVYVLCSLETCMERDPKGLYAKAQSGEITTLPGLQTSYEAPENARW